MKIARDIFFNLIHDEPAHTTAPVRVIALTPEIIAADEAARAAMDNPRITWTFRPSDKPKQKPPVPQLKTRCGHGHAMTPENIVIESNGVRRCRECRRRSVREANSKRRRAGKVQRACPRCGHWPAKCTCAINPPRLCACGAEMGWRSKGSTCARCINKGRSDAARSTNAEARQQQRRDCEAKRTAKRKEAGLCIRCGGTNPKATVRCEPCQKIHRANDNARRTTKKASRAERAQQFRLELEGK